MNIIDEDIEADCNIQTNETDEEESISDEDEEESLAVAEEPFHLMAELSTEYEEAIVEARKVVKMFRKSRTKNDDVLQRYIKQETGHE